MSIGQYVGGGFPYEVPFPMYVKFTEPSQFISTYYLFHSGYVLPMNVLPEKNQFNTGSCSPKAFRFYYFIIASSLRVSNKTGIS